MKLPKAGPVVAVAKNQSMMKRDSESESGAEQPESFQIDKPEEEKEVDQNNTDLNDVIID